MTTTDPRPHTTATIEPAELVRMRAEDPAVHVTDVRTPGELETGMDRQFRLVAVSIAMASVAANVWFPPEAKA